MKHFPNLFLVCAEWYNIILSFDESSYIWKEQYLMYLTNKINEYSRVVEERAKKHRGEAVFGKGLYQRILTHKSKVQKLKRELENIRLVTFGRNEMKHVVEYEWMYLTRTIMQYITKHLSSSKTLESCEICEIFVAMNDLTSSLQKIEKSKHISPTLKYCLKHCIQYWNSHESRIGQIMKQYSFYFVDFLLKSCSDTVWDMLLDSSTFKFLQFNLLHFFKFLYPTHDIELRSSLLLEPMERKESQLEEFLSRCNFDHNPWPYQFQFYAGFLFHQPIMHIITRIFKNKNKSVLSFYDRHLKVAYNNSYSYWKCGVVGANFLKIVQHQCQNNIQDYVHDCIILPQHIYVLCAEYSKTIILHENSSHGNNLFKNILHTFSDVDIYQYFIDLFQICDMFNKHASIITIDWNALDPDSSLLQEYLMKVPEASQLKFMSAFTRHTNCIIPHTLIHQVISRVNYKQLTETDQPRAAMLRELVTFLFSLSVIKTKQNTRFKEWTMQRIGQVKNYQHQFNNQVQDFECESFLLHLAYKVWQITGL